MINTKRIYTIATVNGFSHADVKGYIAFEFGLDTTKDLTQEQYNQLINYLDKEVVMAEQKTFANGMYGKNPREGAPDFVIGSVSFKVEDFIPFLKDNVNDKGYVNIDINKGKEGKWNCFLNTYGLVKKEAPKEDEPAF